MHSAFASSVVLFLLTSTSSTIAQAHDGILKQNHHQFQRVKRSGGTLHLIGDETVAKWNGGSVAGLPKPSVVVPVATTSYTNLMDSINAGLGVPVGRPTASPSSSSSSIPKPALAVSTSSKSSASSSKAGSSSSPKAASSSSKAASSASSSTKVALAAGRGAAIAPSTASAQPSKRNLVAFNATVAEDVDEDHINALGRRATGNTTLALGRGRGASPASSSASSSGSTSSVVASASSDIPVAETQAAVAFSAADLGTSQGWGALFASKYTSMSVNNHAVKGASARSVYRDLWPAILSSIKSGDVVLFQLGHYDSVAPGSSQDTAEGCIGAAPGSGDGTITITSGCTGTEEVVRTYVGYISEMCKAAKGKGATCLVASVTPKNKFSGSSLNYNSPYTSQAKAAAAAAGGTYVPHLEAIGKQVAAQGASVARNYWLSGNQLQPNAAGADAFASAFAAAVGCAGVGSVTSGLTAAGKAVSGLC